jgi:hypothetical protein
MSEQRRLLVRAVVPALAFLAGLLACRYLNRQRGR